MSTKNNNHHRHWHHVYRRRRRRALGISSKEIAVGQLISIAGAVVAGFHLDNHKTTLALIVGTFVILPAVFDLNGSLGGAMSAKINHHLESSRARTWRIFLTSTAFALLIALLAGTVVGLVGGFVASSFFGADFSTIFKLSVGAILLGAAIGFPLVALFTILLRKLGVNPDDVMGPVETTFFDILTVFALVIVAGRLV